MLSELRGRGLILAICSNWDWDIARAVASAGMEGMTDVVVTSAQAGARKPHLPHLQAHPPAMCRRATRRCCSSATPCTPTSTAPMSFGMAAVHVWRDDMVGDPGSLPAGALRVPDLRPLLDVVRPSR